MLGSILTILANNEWKKAAEIEARKLMTFGGLLGGAGGSGEVCLNLQILQSMVRHSTHARLPLRECGES